jgi:hypothetical protein
MLCIGGIGSHTGGAGSRQFELLLDLWIGTWTEQDGSGMAPKRTVRCRGIDYAIGGRRCARENLARLVGAGPSSVCFRRFRETRTAAGYS